MERSLSDAQIEYYSRQILLRELGGRGQKRLLGAACLLAGAGEANTVAATYLAGAGIGRLDVLGAERAGATVGSPFAPLAQRNPDVRCRDLDTPPARLDEYSAAVVEAPAAALLRHAAGRPRHGEVLVEIDGDGATRIVVIPGGADGCALCVIGTSAADSAAGGRPEGAALALAGSLAALAVCRWIAGLAVETEALAWRLAPGAAIFAPATVAFAPSCARGCRSAGRSLP
jgi:hypothetical protein